MTQGTIPTLEDIDRIHRTLAPSDAAYELIHTHCVIVAQITRQLIHRQNALFMRRCTLPADAVERTGDYGTVAGHDIPSLNLRISAPFCAPTSNDVEEVERWELSGTGMEHGNDSPEESCNISNDSPTTVPATDGVTGGMIPPYYLDVSRPVVGALLHDIGAYKVLEHDGSDGEPLEFDRDNYIKHGIIGYNLLLDMGVDESIAEFARNHTGVGLTREQVLAEGLPIPPDDYVPVNLEQEVVMVADKYHSKSVPPRFVTAERYAKSAARFGDANRDRWLELVRKYGTPDVPALAKQWGMGIK
ncbi:HD domain-containing protein [Bifidobacterium choloepi]|uniref:HD domain-containing protein n=1 Tax=Bifidobacterium choloepi TaxID=2614131 RepID=A0A6I5ND81_9BIFI|nr:HD domain-containing protein [Bifidobacterium choloepi]NEG70500.1 HD domain-containing protein [Bifidobacterium choloepi]